MMHLYWKAKRFWSNEQGLGTLEIILIIAVIIIIALLFKNWIVPLIQDLIDKADNEANKIFD